MEPTPFPSENELPALPVSRAPASIEAYQRAPTLMAGMAAGQQGRVQVWMPSRRRVRGWTLGVNALGLIYISLMVRHWVRGEPWDLENISSLLCFPFMATWFVKALIRPCYITTDDAGIALTTWKGSKAFQWSELQKVVGGDSSIALRTSETLDMWLFGYSKADSERLLALIVEKAALLPHPRKKQVFLSPAALKKVPAQLGPWDWE